MGESKMDFILDSKVRENSIFEIRERKTPVATGIMLPIRPAEKFSAYPVNIDFLVYNHLNDRFASSRSEFFENEHKSLDLTTQESLLIIERFIWESNVTSNEKTLKDLLKNGQKVPGVITKDGRIIDGNRRASLMRRIFLNHTNYGVDQEKFRYFNCVILEDDISDEEMIILETKIQMGEDPKLDYNATEKYLKVDKLYTTGKNYAEIADLINSLENDKKAEEAHQVYKLMVEYLDYIKAHNQFSLLNKMEDHFIKLNESINSFNKGKLSTNWNPSETDFLEAKYVGFNFIRKGHEGKDFRNLIGGVSKNKGIFKHKDVWEKFIKKHDNLIDEVDKEINRLEFETAKQREDYWKEKTSKRLDNIFSSAKEALNNRILDNKPKELLDGALDKINNLDLSSLVMNFEKGELSIDFFEDIFESLDDIESAVKKLKGSLVDNVFKKKR